MTSSPSAQVGKDSLSPMERAAQRELMVLDIKVKLQSLWLCLLKLGATDDPHSSFEYGTILIFRFNFVQLCNFTRVALMWHATHQRHISKII
ncbi:DENN domain and WD repeat-containing protein SCD1-like [Mercurialis annua]|uniref:DENN domain and WD repeat-containing protein SCD1-like n=1 Tax=Mercurialis annua TaxID=3986 RepID=UPI00215FD741|nr:DENN domain and WD repeat-containing protein SCD1-like [Mercurialis annua]